jgi:hypothetical protein
VNVITAGSASHAKHRRLASFTPASSGDRMTSCRISTQNRRYMLIGKGMAVNGEGCSLASEFLTHFCAASLNNGKSEYDLDQTIKSVPPARTTG